jgi:beta-carotene 3-hydroxylase
MDVMAFLVPLLIVIGTVAFMEFFAWWAHKYIMHGELGWGWHKSHHEPHEPGFEKNDLYAVVFALFAIGLFWFGGTFWQPLWWVALGITVYGVLYFVAHDGLVHQRWPFKYVPRKGYLKRLYQAHRLHHAVEGKDGCVSFGFIYAPPIDELVKELDKGKRPYDKTSRDDSGISANSP